MHRFEKWYYQKLKEEMEWEDHVAQEVAEAGAAHTPQPQSSTQPDATAGD